MIRLLLVLAIAAAIARGRRPMSTACRVGEHDDHWLQVGVSRAWVRQCRNCRKVLGTWAG